MTSTRTISAGLTRRVAGAAIAALLLAGTACDLDLSNPNNPTEEAVLSDPEGIIAVAAGMQAQFAETIDDYMVTNSLVTDEWGTRTLALVSYISLMTGENFSPDYGVVYTPYFRTYLTVKSANTVLAGADDPVVGPLLGTNMRVGVRALAHLFKAMALGMAVQQYEEIPINPAPGGADPQPRDIVLDTILTLLDSARKDLATPGLSLTDFNSRVLGLGINLPNTINAMLARYYLLDGQYQAAIDAANRVPLPSISELQYPTPNRNPIENLAFQLQYVGGLESFANEAQAGDARPAYWLNTAAADLPSNPPDTSIKALRKYSMPQESFPIYLPDEMKLIKAEAYTRLGGAANFLLAAALVNEVRTQTTSTVDEPVAALGPIAPAGLDTEAELLDAIAYERRYELYMQGMRWEDTRRLGTARTTTPTMPWLPIPTQECQTNPLAECG